MTSKRSVYVISLGRERERDKDRVIIAHYSLQCKTKVDRQGWGKVHEVRGGITKVRKVKDEWACL